MPNGYFQFKQFKINQSQCAMKVTTEGCLFAALVAPVKVPTNVLDIGSGTGLLSLMLAQRFPNAKINGIEVDTAAAHQSRENFASSPWASNLSVDNIAIQNFKTESTYDLIVTNPPFFKGSQLGLAANENIAKHEATLNQQDLITAIGRLLSVEGELWVLYPEYEAKVFSELASKLALYRKSRTLIKNQEGAKVFRVVQVFSREWSEEKEEEVVIRKGNGYTGQFSKLLSGYYLNL